MANGFRAPHKIARRLRLGPTAARFIRDWPRFMFNYSLGLVPSSPYAFRNGARLQIGRGVDHVPIIEIFMRDDYGTVPRGATVLDLGANIGTFSIYATTTARDVTVYAYEPVTEFFRLLQHNVSVNGVSGRVKCFNVAVAATAVPRALNFAAGGRPFPTLADHGEGAADRRVPCTTLADILADNGLERVDLMKLDCEGSEYEILFNTPADVLDRIMEIRMEYHDLGVAGCDPRQLRRFLQSRDFAIVRDKPTSALEGSLWGRKL